MKQTFVMYMTWQPLFDNLTAEDAGEMVKAIYKYQATGEEPDRSWSLYPTFMMLKRTMDEDTEKYKAKVERIQNNVNAKSNRNQDENDTKSTRNRNVTDSVTSDTVSISDTVTDTKVKDKKEAYGELGNVKLTVKEREKLIQEYGKDTTEAAIEYLDGYIADKGYKSKSNYQAIRRWVIDAVKDRGRGSPEKFDIDAYLLKEMGVAE